jgi:hypothetical protein
MKGSLSEIVEFIRIISFFQEALDPINIASRSRAV